MEMFFAAIFSVETGKPIKVKKKSEFVCVDPGLLSTTVFVLSLHRDFNFKRKSDRDVTVDCKKTWITKRLIAASVIETQIANASKTLKMFL